MLRRLARNESGMVLLTVLMVIAVMMIFTIGLLSRSVTQTISSERQVDRIKAEQFLKGAFWLVYSNLVNGAPPASSVSQTIDGKTYNAVIGSTPGAGPNGTAAYSLNIIY